MQICFHFQTRKSQWNSATTSKTLCSLFSTRKPKKNSLKYTHIIDLDPSKSQPYHVLFTHYITKQYQANQNKTKLTQTNKQFLKTTPIVFTTTTTITTDHYQQKDQIETGTDLASFNGLNELDERPRPILKRRQSDSQEQPGAGRGRSKQQMKVTFSEELSQNFDSHNNNAQF